MNRSTRPIIILFLATLFLTRSVMALEVEGLWTEGALLLGKVFPGETVRFMGKTPRVSSEGTFVIGLGRDVPETVTLEVNGPSGAKVHTFSVEQRKYQEQRIDGVPQRTVTPPADVSERIAQEAALVWQVRSNNSPHTDFLSGFRMPLAGPITGVYGSRRVFNGTPKAPHYGLDIAAPEGVVVSSPAPGRVSLVHKDMYFSGGTLIIDHGHGVFSTFIHLSEILVEEGDRLNVGDPIAKVGATGRATGPHLDWRINWFDVRIDPELVLTHLPVRQ